MLWIHNVRMVVCWIKYDKKTTEISEVRASPRLSSIPQWHQFDHKNSVFILNCNLLLASYRCATIPYWNWWKHQHKNIETCWFSHSNDNSFYYSGTFPLVHTFYSPLSPYIYLTMSLSFTLFHSRTPFLFNVFYTASPLDIAFPLFSSEHVSRSPLPCLDFSSPPVFPSPLPWVLCWEHNSRICFAASHQISVDFSAAKLQFSRVDELL